MTTCGSRRCACSHGRAIPRALPILTAAVKDKDADVRQQAVWALARTRDRAVVPTLIGALSDESADVRQHACLALGQLKDPAAVRR